MSVTLALFVALFLLFCGLSLIRPVWGVSLYMLTFFACPPFWWWGKSVAEIRWNFYGGVGLLIAVLISKVLHSGEKRPDTKRIRQILTIATLILVNATAVHLVLSNNWGVSFASYEALAKFVLLFFLIVASIRTPADLRLIMMTLIIGATYLGYEATINGRGRITHGRLEGVGAPGARGANELASLAVTIIPMAGTAFLAGRPLQKVVMFFTTPFILNVILLCSSRAGFLAMIASGITILVCAPGKLRRQAIKLLCLGCVALFFLIGDDAILARFETTFADSEHRDASAATRLDYWKAGIRMIIDYPAGAGGNGFKKVHGPKYIREVNDQDFNSRAVHNGYINEACEWGIQGFVLRMLFIGVSLIIVYQTVLHLTKQGMNNEALYGCGILAGHIAFLVTCMFGDRLDAEWGYWMVALSVGYARLYGPPLQQYMPFRHRSQQNANAQPYPMMAASR